MLKEAKLLLVDDDDALRQSLRDQPEFYKSFSIDEASSGSEALEFIKGSLLLNGFAIIEKDAKTDVLINAAGKSPVGIKLDPRVYVDAADLPEPDTLAMEARAELKAALSELDALLAALEAS